MGVVAPGEKKILYRYEGILWGEALSPLIVNPETRHKCGHNHTPAFVHRGINASTQWARDGLGTQPVWAFWG